jgi:hypothetical protein
MYFKLQRFNFFFVCSRFVFEFILVIAIFIVFYYSTAEVVRCVQVIKEIINSSKVVLLS